MNNKKITFVVPRFHTNLFFATKALVEAGYRVSVLCYKEARLEDHRYVKPLIFTDKNSPSDVADALDQIGPDLIFLRKSKPLSDHVSRHARKGRYMVVHYDLKPLTRIRTFYSYLKWRVRGLTPIRVTPVRGLDHSAPLDGSAFYLPWPVQRLDNVEQERQRDGDLRVLCVGKLKQPRKQHDKLISVLENHLKAGRVSITLAGSSGTSIHGSDVNYYEKLVEQAKIHKGSINILEDVPFSQMAELYASHDVCVLPARGELLGIAPIEGMPYGCVPIISSECGSAGYLTSGKDGYVYDVGDLSTLQMIMDRLVNDRDHLEKLSLGAKNTAETELSPKKFVERVENIMELVTVTRPSSMPDIQTHSTSELN
ncbi:MAG: glycosyltransferase family 4 protein [Pseudomonadota bacterium]